MKCRVDSAILLSPCYGVTGLCDHKFCQSCFRKENIELAYSLTHTFKCPCCHSPFYDNMHSIDEAILIGEASTLYAFILPQFVFPSLVGDVTEAHEINKLATEKLEEALQLNSTNFNCLYTLFSICSNSQKFFLEHKVENSYSEFYRLRIYDLAFKLLDHPAIPESHESVRGACNEQLAGIFTVHLNHSAALHYSKLAYEHYLRSSDHTYLLSSKAFYLKMRTEFAQQPPR